MLRQEVGGASGFFGRIRQRVRVDLVPKTKRPSFRINDRVSPRWMIPAYGGKPHALTDTVLRVSSVSGTGSVRNPWQVSVTDDAGHFWTLTPDEVVPAASHMTKRAPAGRKATSSSKADKALDREIADAVGLRDGWAKAKVRKGWPETWDKQIKGRWHTLELQPSGGWSHGTSHRRGDADYIDRGSRFPTWEAAAAFSEKW